MSGTTHQVGADSASVGLLCPRGYTSHKFDKEEHCDNILQKTLNEVCAPAKVQNLDAVPSRQNHQSMPEVRTFQLILSDFAKFHKTFKAERMSPEYYVQNVPFKVCVGNCGQHMSVQLCADKLPEFARPCYGEVTFIILPIDPSDAPLSTTVPFLLTEKCVSIQYFKKWSLFTDKFVHEDTAILEIIITLSKLRKPYFNVFTDKRTSTINKSDYVTPGEDAENVIFKHTDGGVLEDQQQRFERHLTCGVGSDCEFLVGTSEQKILKASKIMLARVSPVFDAMFYGELPEQNNPIVVPDVEPDIFLILLKSTYGCRWSVKSTQIERLFYAAHKYMCVELMDSCVSFLSPTYVNGIFWLALDVATRYSRYDLLQEVMKVVTVSPLIVFKSDEFVHISRDALAAILMQNGLNVSSEIEVFVAALDWAKFKCDEKGLPHEGKFLRAELSNEVQHIRFLSMNEKEFSGLPVKSDVLTSEESLAIIVRILQKLDKPLLPGLCPFKLQRTKCYTS